MRQGAYCWHVPGGLVGGWRLWEAELCGEIEAICPLSLRGGGGAVIQEAFSRMSPEAPWLLPLLQTAQKSKWRLYFFQYHPKSHPSGINPCEYIAYPVY